LGQYGAEREGENSERGERADHRGLLWGRFSTPFKAPIMASARRAVAIRVMDRQIAPVAQRHGIGIAGEAMGGGRRGDQASEAPDEARHFVTSFRVGIVFPCPRWPLGTGCAMDKVAAPL